MTEPITTTQLTIHGGLAIFGAIAHALNAQRNGTSKTFMDFLALIIMSSFSGAMFSLLGLYLFGGSSYATMALAGTGGYLGVEGMAVLGPILIEKIRTLMSK